MCLLRLIGTNRMSSYHVFCTRIPYNSDKKVSLTVKCYLGGRGVLDIWSTIKIGFMVFLKEGSEIYQLLFTSWKNFDSSRSYHWSKVSAYVWFYFTRDFHSRSSQKLIFQTSKSISSYSFWAIILKLSGYVLGSIWRRIAEQNFELGL